MTFAGRNSRSTRECGVPKVQGSTFGVEFSIRRPVTASPALHSAQVFDHSTHARAWNGQAKGAGFAGKLSTAGWSGVIAFSAPACLGNLPLASCNTFPLIQSSRVSSSLGGGIREAIASAYLFAVSGPAEASFQ